jgi:hypothetical protein
MAGRSVNWRLDGESPLMQPSVAVNRTRENAEFHIPPHGGQSGNGPMGDDERRRA